MNTLRNSCESIVISIQSEIRGKPPRISKVSTLFEANLSRLHENPKFSCMHPLPDVSEYNTMKLHKRRENSRSQLRQTPQKDGEKAGRAGDLSVSFWKKSLIATPAHVKFSKSRVNELLFFVALPPQAQRHNHSLPQDRRLSLHCFSDED
jgi:hypothetical protein